MCHIGREYDASIIFYADFTGSDFTRVSYTPGSILHMARHTPFFVCRGEEAEIFGSDKTEFPLPQVEIDTWGLSEGFMETSYRSPSKTSSRLYQVD